MIKLCICVEGKMLDGGFTSTCIRGVSCEFACFGGVGGQVHFCVVLGEFQSMDEGFQRHGNSNSCVYRTFVRTLYANSRLMNTLCMQLNM